jgi:hypothetical protein
MAKQSELDEQKAGQAAGTPTLSVKEISDKLWYACHDIVVSSNDPNVMSVQAAIAAGADVNYSPEGMSCLSVAAGEGYHEIVGLLLTTGAADMEAKSAQRDCTALHFAASLGYTQCVELLATAGADKEAKMTTGATPLIMAAMNGHNNCVEVLLNAGCDINTPNNEGVNALQFAVNNEHIDCVRTLVRCGADVLVQSYGYSHDDVADRTYIADELKAALRVPAEKRRRCAQCDKTTSEKLQKCSACRKVYYCNRECQVAHWKRHKPACNVVVE